MKIVSDGTITRPPGPGIKNSLWLVVRKDLAGQVQSAADLKGRKIAVQAMPSVAELQLEKTLAYHNLKLEDVQIEVIPFSDQITALANGAVDAAMAIEPLVTQAEIRNVAVPLFEVPQAMPNHTFQWLYYNGELIRSQPDAGRRFLAGYVKSLRYMEDAWRKGVNRDDVVQIFIKHTPVKEPGLYQRMGVSYSETNGRVNLQALEVDQDFYVRRGVVKQKVDPSRIVDPSFGEYVVQVLGRYED